MALRRITAESAIHRLSDFSSVIDARSESEFAEDHLPGAVNWPTLTDEQRHLIGTEYKQVSPFDARKRGAAMAAHNIARHIEQQAMDKPRDWQPLVYCWRGGQRSGALAMVLDQIGFTVHVLEGGYREFRRAVLADLDIAPPLNFTVLCGRTGSAKSRLLQALVAQGAQVLDLEGIACHRGSVLGLVPGQPQPSQKAFETQLWQALRGLDAQRPVFVEGESRTIGRLRLPEKLLVAMRASRCVRVELPLLQRVQMLMEDYAHFVTDIDAFCERLDALRDLRSSAVVQGWQAQARAGAVAAVVQELLTLHYDPVYERSMQRNFADFDKQPVLTLADAGHSTLCAAAHRLVSMAVMPSPSPLPSPSGIR
jgi:tRNA 2-selenouridine synthase